MEGEGEGVRRGETKRRSKTYLPTCSTCPLPSGSFTNRLLPQRLDRPRSPVYVLFFLLESGVNDKTDSRDGHRRFGNVGGDDDAAGMRRDRLEDLGLGGRRERGVEGKDL